MTFVGHNTSTAALLADLHADAERGLSEEEAERRLSRDGPNRLTRQRGTPAWRRFLDQLIQPLVVVLIVAASVSALMGDTADALVIGAVVLVNSIIGFLQEYRAEQAIAALDALVVTEATVIRDGQTRRIPSRQLVRGDLVSIASGDAVPADLRLLTARELQVDEAALTGESVPVMKKPCVLPADTVLGDRVNMTFAGTAVTYGQGRGVVVATGDATETGRIAGMISQVADIATPLTRRIGKMSVLLVWIILGLASALFVVEAIRGADLRETFNAAVALAVGAIPEGLPAALTVLLAVGVQNMARQNALVRKLPAVETLGSTTIICSDKTGTLTENQMTATHFWTVDAQYTVSGVGYQPSGEFLRDGAAVEPGDELPLLACLRAGVLCNDTRIVRSDGAVKIEGDPTEAALLVAADKGGASRAAAAWRRIAEIPFESQRMYMATLHEGPQGADELDEGRRVFVKGSSDVLLERCVAAMNGSGQLVEFDVRELQRRVEQLAERGLRVLCLAERSVSEIEQIEHDDIRGLTFLGLVGMIDPPRDPARRAIEACYDAGIRVTMITGDHAVTAAAIADQLGMRGAHDPSGRLRSVTGKELEQLRPSALAEVVETVSVFARVAPEQKLLLVNALQKGGHVVAMTGDGVNDAPALKQADLGIAMGRGGTDVARGASAMVLTDDNFETIAAAVEEGRGVYDNLVKFITWTLPTNGGEALVLLAAVVARVALPVMPVQLLWINMATAVLLGIALVFEPKEPGLMKRPPRPVRAPILNWQLGVRVVGVSVVMAAAAFGLFTWALSTAEQTLSQARTIAVNTIVVVEVAYLFSCRSLRLPIWEIGWFKNPWVWVGALVMLTAQLSFTYLPIMNTLFHTSPIDWVWWLYFSVAGGAVLIVVEAFKAFGRRATARTPAK